jgi:tetratricopeptide (TPR) repeat protein
MGNVDNLDGARPEIKRMRAGVRAWVTRNARASARALHKVSPSALLSMLCAAAFSPLFAVGVNITEPMAAAGIAVLSSLGGNALSEVITSAIDRLRARGQHEPSPVALEQEIARQIERVLTRGDSQAETLRREIGAVLADIGTGRTIWHAAIEFSHGPQGPNAANITGVADIIAAVAGLGNTYSDMRFLLADIAAAAAEIRDAVSDLRDVAADLKLSTDRQNAFYDQAEYRPFVEKLIDLIERVASEAASHVPMVELPPDIAYFTGRKGVLTQLQRLLTGQGRKRGAAIAVAAVAGKPGVGKSALAIHAAHLLEAEFSDGQLYINLRGADDQPLSPEEALEDLLRRFGISGDFMPRTLNGKAAVYQRKLAGKRVLVVLDNAANEQQVRPLLPGASACAVIVTSRQVLTALDATVVMLEVLGQASAVKLLRRAAGSSRLRREPEAAVKVAELCGFLPLALRIAGAKLAWQSRWTVARLAERLADERRRLAELGEGDLDVRASFALSYSGLPAKDARAFRLLGLIPAADFDPLIAEAVMDGSGNYEAAEEQLDRLVRLSLLELAPGADRYKFHDLLRLYARECLEADEAPARQATALDEMYSTYALIAEQYEARVFPRFHQRVFGSYSVDLRDLDNTGHFAMFEMERGNLMAAVDSAYEAEDWGWAWRIAQRLTDLLFLYGYWNDCERAAYACVYSISADGTWGGRERYAYVTGHLCMGRISSRQGRWKDAIKWLEQDLTLLAHEPTLEAEILYELGNAHAGLKRWGDAKKLYLQSRDIYEEDEEDGGPHTGPIAMIMIGLANIHRAQGHWTAARAYLEESLECFTADDDLEGQASVNSGNG